MKADCRKVILQKSLLKANTFNLDSLAALADTEHQRCWLHAGLANGVLLGTEVDRVTGQLEDTRTRFLGTRPPKLFAIDVRGQRSMLALSSRPWLGYSDMGRYNLTPLSYEALDYSSSFSSEQCPEGFCAVAKNTLRILSLERLGETFNQQVVQVKILLSSAHKYITS